MESHCGADKTHGPISGTTWFWLQLLRIPTWRYIEQPGSVCAIARSDQDIAAHLGEPFQPDASAFLDGLRRVGLGTIATRQVPIPAKPRGREDGGAICT